MFKIGEFSKLATVPASQLRYYDEVGLFSPALVEPETGYRYYKADQFETLNQIIALKELGFSLKQIRHQLETKLSLVEMRSMLELKKAQAERSLENELFRLAAIEARLKVLDEDSPVIPTVIKSIPEQHMWSVRSVFEDPCETVELMHQLETLALEHSDPQRFRMTAIMYDNEFQLSNMDLEIGFTSSDELRVPKEYRGLSLRKSVLPAMERAVTAIRKGGFDQATACYGAIGTWLGQKKSNVLLPGREVFLVPPKPNKPHDTVVCEIQFELKTLSAGYLSSEV